MVAPDRFVKAMVDHWHGLGNRDSDALRQAWRQMAVAFNHQIIGDKRKEWAVLPMPTGTGKTEGLSLYCSMMQKSRVNHPGVLIITRQIVDADDLRDKINRLAQQDIAVSFHSETNRKVLKFAQARNYFVLIITHQAFGNALEAVANGDRLKSNWDYYVDWSGGTRKLVVIDEALDVTRSYHVGAKDLKAAYDAAPNEIRKLHRAEFRAISDMRKKLAAYAKADRGKLEKLIAAGSWDMADKTDFERLLQTVAKKTTKLRQTIKSDDDAGSDTQKKRKTAFRNTICGMEAMLSGWCIHSAYRKSHTFSTSYLILPSFVKKAVVLDATAAHNPVYGFLKSSVEFVKLQKGMRDYSNVTLNVCYDHPVGKEHITKQDDKHFAVLMNYLADRIGSGKRVFFCVHKAAEDRIRPHGRLFDGFDVGHWGAIDGKNGWQDYDTMVIYGLPYLKPVDPKLSVLAFQDWQNKANGIRKTPELTKDVEAQAARYGRQLLIVKLIQAINRVRCRKVIDRHGNCKKTDIYLFLHHEIEGREIISGIREQMPGLNVDVLDAVPTAKAKRDRSPYGKQIVEYLKPKPPGRYPVRAIQRKFKMSDRTLWRLLDKAKTGKGSFAKALREMNITYDAEWGRGAESCFIKAGKRKRA